MFNAYGLARIGRDAELRSTTQGESVISLSLAFDVFVKREKVTQWVDASLWGKRAESLAPYLLKGTSVSVSLQDVHIETFKNRDGNDVPKLAGRISEIALAGDGKPREQAREEPQRPAARPAPSKPAPRQATGFDDMDDDIPFVTCDAGFDMDGMLARKFRRYGGDL